MRITLEYAKKINPNLNPKLFLPSPKHVWNAMNEPPISEWHKFIAEEYQIPRRVKYLILVPCSAYKPYTPPRDELYRCIHELKAELHNTFFITVSVPLAIEPEDYWNFKWREYNLIYDAPFFPWIEKFGYRWDKEIVKKVLKKLENIFESFWERNRGRFDTSIAFLAPSVPDRKIVENKVDYIVPDYNPPITPSYDNNASEIHCYPSVWNQFINLLQNITKIHLEHLKRK